MHQFVRLAVKQRSSTDTEIARHVRRWMLPKRKTTCFHITGNQDTDLTWHALTISTFCCTWSQSTNVTDRQTDRQTDGRYASSIKHVIARRAENEGQPTKTAAFALASLSLYNIYEHYVEPAAWGTVHMGLDTSHHDCCFVFAAIYRNTE